MRLFALTLSLILFVACATEDAEQIRNEFASSPEIGPHECIGHWPLLSLVPTPELLSPTIEERVAGQRGVALVTLESVTFRVPDRAHNNRRDLGYLYLRFAVIERIKPETSVYESVSAIIEVGYNCEYIEDDERDTEALAKMSAGIEEDLKGKILIVFLQHDGGPQMTGIFSFRQNQPDSIIDPQSTYGFRKGWEEGHPWLMQAEGIGTDQNPIFLDPLRLLNPRDVPVNTISLLEIREKAKAVIDEEKERGIDCVGASYQYEWYVRSGEENWYRGLLSEDGTPVECFAAIP